jgi:hypothetical protein
MHFACPIPSGGGRCVKSQLAEIGTQPKRIVKKVNKVKIARKTRSLSMSVRRWNWSCAPTIAHKNWRNRVRIVSGRRKTAMDIFVKQTDMGAMLVIEKLSQHSCSRQEITDGVCFASCGTMATILALWLMPTSTRSKRTAARIYVQADHEVPLDQIRYVLWRNSKDVCAHAQSYHVKEDSATNSTTQLSFGISESPLVQVP